MTKEAHQARIWSFNGELQWQGEHSPRYCKNSIACSQPVDMDIAREFVKQSYEMLMAGIRAEFETMDRAI